MSCEKGPGTSIVTASMRRAVGVEVLKVDLRPRDEVSAHCDAEERGRPSTSRLRITIVIKVAKMKLDNFDDNQGGQN